MKFNFKAVFLMKLWVLLQVDIQFARQSRRLAVPMRWRQWWLIISKHWPISNIMLIQKSVYTGCFFHSIRSLPRRVCASFAERTVSRLLGQLWKNATQKITQFGLGFVRGLAYSLFMKYMLWKDFSFLLFTLVHTVSGFIYYLNLQWRW